jgi:predicted enzyme related to lactoylglutathione lyase
MNFNSVLIGSENPDRLVEYYTRLFGEPGFSEGGYSGWKIGDGFITVGPHSEVKGSNGEPGRIILNIESTDVPGDAQRWKDAGAIVVREPYEFEGAEGSWIATYADPDGNYFQLVNQMDAPTS